MDRSEDWLRSLGRFAWSCFIAQQSAEKSLKAALEAQGTPTWGHDLVQLLEALAETAPAEESVRDACFRLNLYYVATRYPDAFSSGTPAEKFSERQCEVALEDAEEVLQFAGRLAHRR